MNTTEMTDEQIRVRVAEIEGWTKVIFMHSMPMWIGLNPGGTEGAILPDYTNSIDAINAAVLRLSKDQQMFWAIVMMEKISSAAGFGMCDVLSVATASALDRAKAFIAIHQP